MYGYDDTGELLLTAVPSVYAGKRIINVNGAIYAWDASANGGLGAYVPAEKPEYTDFAALAAAYPTPIVGDSGLVKGGGLVSYAASGWLGDIGVVVDDAAAQAALASCAPGSVCRTAAGAIWTKGA